MTHSLYDPYKPNHKAPCRRTTHAPECRVVFSGQCGPECVPAPCRANGDHPAGEHLDQRHEFYDGPALSLDALPLSVRDSAKKIHREAPGVMPELVDMANEINWLRQQLAHVSVEKDHQVREAMARSASCEHHGKEIEELGKALYAADQRERKVEAARLALLGFYQAVKDAVDQYQNRAVRPDWKVSDVMKVLAGAVKKAGAAHDRAWR